MSTHKKKHNILIRKQQKKRRRKVYISQSRTVKCAKMCLYKNWNQYELYVAFRRLKKKIENLNDSNNE